MPVGLHASSSVKSDLLLFLYKLQFENREMIKFFNECGQKDIHFLALFDSIEENDNKESSHQDHHYVFQGAN